MPRTIIFLALTLWMGSLASGQTYTGPKCLGPFCIDRAVPARTLFEQLGSPSARLSEFSPYCYQAQDRKAFLYIDTFDSDSDKAAGILLGDFPNCVHMPVQTTHDDLHAWKTRERIGLGSLETDVIKAYGSQFSKEEVVLGDDRLVKFMIRGHRQGDKPLRVGDRTISYSGARDDLRTVEFCIRDGKVSCIFLSQNE
jgi:hypothetical protein